jgi:hypothetical protein
MTRDTPAGQAEEGRERQFACLPRHHHVLDSRKADSSTPSNNHSQYGLILGFEPFLHGLYQQDLELNKVLHCGDGAAASTEFSCMLPRQSVLPGRGQQCSFLMPSRGPTSSSLGYPENLLRKRHHSILLTIEHETGPVRRVPPIATDEWMVTTISFSRGNMNGYKN